MYWDDVPVHLQVNWDVRECTLMPANALERLLVHWDDRECTDELAVFY